MKKVININFQGRVVPIEETSFDLLKQYTDSLRNYFANEEGKDEIINDIESRIGELFQERIKNGSTCITDDDINAIINSIGRPKDFADADDNQPTGTTGANTNQQTFGSEYNYQSTYNSKRLYRDANNKVIGGVCSGIAAYFSIEPIIVRLVFIFSGIGFFAYILLWAFVPSSNTVKNGVRKRLYRNPDNKFIAGVCSGIASYFNINVWIPRVIFLVPFISFFFRMGHYGPFSFPQLISFSFSPGSFFLYVILWMVLPEASTTSEKLEMKGERVDINSIKNSVKEEMKEVKERMEKIGKEAQNFAQEKGKAMSADLNYSVRRTRSGLGNIIVFIVKAFAYFIIGCVLLSLVVALFSVAVAAIGIFPLKDFVLTNGWQNFYAWGSLLFFIGVPVIGVITWIIRRIAKIKSKNNLMRYSFLALWLLGVFCFVSLIFSVGRDFKSNSTISEEQVPINNPGVSKLEITSYSNKYYNTGWFRLEPFTNIDDDTAYVANIRVRIIKSINDSFKVTVKKMSNGQTRAAANNLASLIQYNITQNDSLLTIDRAIPINTTNKFRNQRVVVTIAVPVGKQIKIDRNVGWANWVHFNGPWNNNNNWYDEDWDNEEHGWGLGIDYIMKADGLYTLSGKPADHSRSHRNASVDNGDDNEEEGDNVNQNQNQNNTGGYHYEKTQKSFDSLKQVLEIQKRRALDSLNKAEEIIKLQKQKLEKKNDANQPKQEAYFPLNESRYGFVLDI